MRRHRISVLIVIGASAALVACGGSTTVRDTERAVGAPECCAAPAEGACASDRMPPLTSAAFDEELNDFASILADARSSTCAQSAALALQRKLRLAVEYPGRPCLPGLKHAVCGSGSCQRPCWCGSSSPFRRSRGGLLVAHAFAAALALDAQAVAVPADIAGLLGKTRDLFGAPPLPEDAACGSTTNSCQDDHAATAAGLAWIAAWEAKRDGGDAFTWLARTRARVAAAFSPLSKSRGSVCHHVVGSAPPRCDGDVVPPDPSKGEVRVRPIIVENGHESPASTLAALASLALASSGLGKAGRPLRLTSREGAIAAALVEAVQTRIVATADSTGAVSFDFAAGACLSFSTADPVDCDENQALGDNAWRPSDFPLRRFLVAHDIPIRSTVQDDTCNVRPAYDFATFDDARYSRSRCAFYGPGRRSLHLDFGAEAWPELPPPAPASWETSAQSAGGTCAKVALSSYVIRKCRDLIHRDPSDPRLEPYSDPSVEPRLDPEPYPRPRRLICKIDPGSCSIAAPSGLRAVPRLGGLEVTWNQVSGAALYDVCVSTSPGACTGTVFDTPSTDAWLTDLSPVPHYIAVRGKYVDTLGCLSPEIEVTPAAMTPGSVHDFPAYPQAGKVTLAGIGDVDGDGAADYAVGLAWREVDGKADAGLFFAVSGASGAVLYELKGENAQDTLGTAIASIGDVDGDRVPDIAVGAPNFDLSRGRVYVLSGATGATLYVKDGIGPYGSFGFSLSAGRDADGDGQPDLLVGSPSAWVYVPSLGYSRNYGSAFLLSGPTGEVLARYDGEAHLDRFGWSVALINDIDWDGLADVVVGAPLADAGGLTDAGRVYSLGGLSGLEQMRADGAIAGDRLGYLVARLGDVDGDGRDDVLAAAPRVGGGTPVDVGSAYVYSGLDGTLLHEVRGEWVDDGFGKYLAGVGDFDGDGVGDYALGAPWGETNGAQSGYVSLFSGATGGRIAQVAGIGSYALLGQAIAASDIDGDGRPELLAWKANAWDDYYGTVKAFTSTPLVRIAPAERAAGLLARPQTVTVRPGASLALSVSGGDAPYAWTVLTDRSGGAAVSSDGVYTAGTTTNLVYDTVRVVDSIGRSDDLRIAVEAAPVPGPVVTRTHWAPTQHDSFGLAIAFVGDIDGDGAADYAVGAPSTQTGTGVVYVYSGRTGVQLRKLTGEATYSYYGTAIVAVGDVNGDGTGDFAVSAYLGGSNYGGTVYMISGANGTTLWQQTGGHTAQFGWSLARAGDIDGDGKTDVVVSAPTFNPDWPYAGPSGVVYILSGADGSVLREARNNGTYSSFGQTVAGGADLSGDGVPDFLVSVREGSYYKVLVLSGADASVLWVYSSGKPSDGLGLSMAVVRDRNEDGLSDILMGAFYDDAVYLWAASQWPFTIFNWSGTQSGEQYGRSVASAGDRNGDGIEDYVVGAPGRDVFYSNAGAVEVRSGADWSLLETHVGEDFLALGQQVAGGADVNASGYPAILASGTLSSNNSYMDDLGFVRLYTREPPEIGFGDRRVPARPAGVRTTQLSFEEVLLEWDTVSNLETGFVIEVRTAGGFWQTAGTAAAGARSFHATALAPNRTYRFRVKAFNDVGDSRWSAPVTGLTTEH